jgi:hypothetical protein
VVLKSFYNFALTFKKNIMASLNIPFEIPQSPSFNMEEFRKKVEDYVKSLLRQEEQREARSENSRVLKYEELSPEIQALCGICKGAVAEDDLNGDSARKEHLKEKFLL